MAKLKEYYDQLHAITTIESFEVQCRGIEDLRSRLDKIQSDMNTNHTQIEKQRVLSWLSTENQLGVHGEHADNFLEGTLETILNSDTYYQWQNSVLNDDGNPAVPATLWCHGPPGAGKSALVYAAIENLRKFYGEEAIVVHMYCTYEKLNTSSLRNVFATMAREAVTQLEILPAYVIASWKEHCYGAYPPSEAFVRGLLCRLLSSRRKCFIIIDALDEITLASAHYDTRLLWPHHLIKEMNKILKELNQLNAAFGQFQCRTLVTSRERCPSSFSPDDFKEMFIEATEVDVELKVRKAIDNGLLGGLAADTGSQSALSTRITEVITKSTQGIFLLATLQLHYLSQFTAQRELEDALKDLPQDLGDSHKRSMIRIQNQPRSQLEKAFAVLSLVYHAKSVLTIRSAQQALAVRHGDRNFDEAGVDSAETLMRITAGLLSIRSNNLVFVHHSVREFLREKSFCRNSYLIRSSEHLPDHICQLWEKYQGHSYVANQCLNFLKLRDFHEALDDGDRSMRTRAFPFLAYAANNAGYHVNIVSLEKTSFELTQQCFELLEDDVMPLGTLQEFLSRN